ncbi:MAG: PEP-utilizing enzyme [Patescibacteria group bacterium]
MSKKTNWIVLTLPAQPITTSAVNISLVDYLEQSYPGLGIDKIVCVYHKPDEVGWLLDADEYLRKGKKNFNRAFLNKMKRDFTATGKNFYGFIKFLFTQDVKSTRLESDFFKFIKLYLAHFATVYPVTGPITFGYSDFFVNKFLRRHNYSPQALESIKIFTKPSHNFIADEEKSLRQIKKMLVKKKINLGTLARFEKDVPDLYQSLVEHQHKYYWLSNNYKDTCQLDISYFFSKLKSIKLIKEVDNKSIITRRKLFLRGYLDKKDIVSLQMLGEMAGLQDLRKKANMCANYWLLEFIKKLAVRYHLAGDLSKLLVLPEILSLLTDKQINLASLRQRQYGLINFTFLNREYILTDRDFKLVKHKLENIIKKASVDIIKGSVGNFGKVQGRARVVIDIKSEARKIKRGDILVTSMTRPEFVPYLKLVKGIVTDEGGITSHAAVVAREFNLPCVIGTKIATKVLKDGDLVEVDANKGVVKILKRR